MTDGLDISRRRALAALGSIGVASVGAGLGTSAFFSDRETFTNNALVAGSLDLGVGYSAHYSDWSPDEAEGLAGPVRTFDGGPTETGGPDDLDPGEVGLPTNDAWLIALQDEADAERFLANTRYRAFNDGSDALADCPLDAGDQAEAAERPVIELADVKPGDFGEVTFDFRLCDNPGFVWVTGRLLSASENGTTEPEADDEDEVEGVVELLDEVRAAVWVDDGDNYQDADEEPVATGTLAEVLNLLSADAPGFRLNGDLPAPEGGGTGATNCFSADTRHSIAVAWWLPVDHANEIQTDSARFDLGFYAEQERHNDGAGQPTRFTVRIENVSGPAGGGGTVNGLPIPLSPGAYAVHAAPGPIFTPGEPASPGLEDVAEDGVPTVLAGELAGQTGLTDSGAFGEAETTTDPNQPPPPAPQPPIFPGGAYEFEVAARPGDALSFATMFIQSNDLVYAPGPDGIPLFDADGVPADGDVTDAVGLWDASTEDDQPPGLGEDQAPRQAALDTGAADTNSTTVQPVAAVNDEGYVYPPDESVIRVTVGPS